MGEPVVERGAGYLVKRVQQSLRRSCDAALRPMGLSMAQYAVLRALADHPEASASELARLCFVTRQSLRDVLTALRSADLVRTATGSSGGRTVPLTLTAAGRRTLAASHDAVIAVELAMLQGLSAADRDDLEALLSRCAENLESGPVA